MTPVTDSDLPTRLRRVRNDLDYNQEEAGGKGAGVSRKAVGDWEKGKNLPQLEYVVWLCKQAQVSPNWLLFGEGPKRLSDVRDSDWYDGAEAVASRVRKALGEAYEAAPETGPDSTSDNGGGE